MGARDLTRAQDPATYLYCLVHGASAPRLRRPPRGLPGAGPARTLDGGDGLWLVVAAAPLPRYSAAAIERGLRDLAWVSACAVGHEAVVEHAARAGTVIPMKLFTLFASDERALAHVSRTRRRVDRLIARVAGRGEWGVRLSLDRTRARRAIAARAGRDTRGAASGTAFLVRRKQEHDAARDLLERARVEADRVYQGLARRADDARRSTPAQPPNGVRVLLEAAFLVDERRAAAFRAAVRAEGRRLDGAGLDIALTGPWPPYTFVADPA
jgi:Gas vesicle synthesis protein GvpL/GvpF